MAKAKVAILISGRGTNMASLIEAAKKDDYPAEIVCVMSNNPAAAGIEVATLANIPVEVVNHLEYEDRESFEAVMTEKLEKYDPDIICLAGFMRILTESFVTRWMDKVVNIHPSLLPSFPGVDTHRRALDAGVRITGCTVHYVRAEMDSGPIIAQSAVPVFTNDTEEQVSERVLETEHRLYIHALDLLASGRARTHGERVVIDSDEPVDTTLFSPPTRNSQV